MEIKMDKDSSKTWAEVNEITAKLKEIDKQLKLINPAFFGAVVYIRGEEMWVGADWQYKSSYDWDDSIGMRCFEKMRTDTPEYGKPWTFIGYVQFTGAECQFLSESEEVNEKHGQRACDMVGDEVNEAVKWRVERDTKDLSELRESYVKYHETTGDDKRTARRHYAWVVAKNPKVAAANGYPKFAHLKMLPVTELR
jgi:hypothetical protein